MSETKFKIGDKVRILDGSEIKNYTGGFTGGMAALVGKVATVRWVEPWSGGRIAYWLEGVKDVDGYVWDERGLQLVAAEKPRKIIVMQDKEDPMKVIARDLDTGKVGVAKCSPQDAFDFCTGAKLAFDRLMGREEKPEEPKPITNYDRIISKTPEELAEWLVLVEQRILEMQPALERPALYKDWLDWLKQEDES